MAHDYLRTCRLCGKSAWAEDMVKYGTRSYAHPQCFIDKKTVADLQALPAYARKVLDEWWVSKYGPIEED